MNRWLIKADPEDYGAAELERDGQTDWDGVTNATALIHLRAMRRGDAALVYHTAKEKAIVALAVIAAAAKPHPADESGKLVIARVRFDGWLARHVALADLRPMPEFASLELVRNSRLSVMPVSKAHWDRIMDLAGGVRLSGGRPAPEGRR